MVKGDLSVVTRDTIPVMKMDQGQFESLKAETLAQLAKSFPPPMDRDYGYAVVVLSHGFVYVGDVSIAGEGVAIGRPLNIRQWGTSKGLGQLAVEGPQKETVLDRCGTIWAPKLALIHIMSVTAAAKKRWETRDELKGHS